MITQAEAFALAASWPVYAASATHPPSDDLNLYCGAPRNNPEPGDWRTCAQSVGQLRRGGGIVYNGSLDEMLSMVLRHMVMVHDVSLAGLRKQDNGPSTGST
jgi:hypothetical protein